MWWRKAGPYEDETTILLIGCMVSQMDTPSKIAGPAHRLLYRGSLSLPDSHLLLDGLSFTVKLGDVHGSPALLKNTLALTLESLRGLPLHLIGPAKVKETWIDPPGDINV